MSRSALNVILAEIGGIVDEVFDDQIIAHGTHVLIVGQRVHSHRPGNLPGSFCEVEHRAEHIGIEYVTAGRFEHDQDVVAAGVGLLQFLEGQQLRVLIAEKGAVVAGEAEKACTGCHQYDHHEAQSAITGQRHRTIHSP